MDDRTQKILENFPFLSYGTMQDKEYLGVIQNSDRALLSMYVLDLIPEEELRKEFLRLASSWWWESNRTIPINIFLQGQFSLFRPYLRHFSRKDFNLISGPAVSLQDAIARRVRTRQVCLVRPMT